MKFTISKIAEMLNGEVIGNPKIWINQLTKIEEGCEHSLSFLSNPKYTQYIYKTKSSAVIVNKDFVPQQKINTTLIKVKDAYTSFAQLLKIVEDIQKKREGIEQPCFIDETAVIDGNIYIGAFSYIGKNVRIGKNVQIYPQCYIGDNVTIKNNSTLYSGVKIYHNCHIDKNSTIHSGSVIGSDGFGFTQNTERAYDKIPQVGNVIIKEDVEIGANTCIDRATMGSTIINKGVKLDNMIQVAHNVEIGENTVIASHTAIAGSSKIGENCMIGGQVAIAGHLTIANQVKIAGKTGIAKSVTKDGEILQGPLAFNLKDFQRSYIFFRQLPILAKRIEKLEKEFIL
tara:strand:+ start:970 stop:1995 length:1026 start_codon:yes stop_codon:yes gene_type:complete